MSLTIQEEILDNWNFRTKKYTDVAQKIVESCRDSTTKVIEDTKEQALREARSIPVAFDQLVSDRFQGLVLGIAKHLMRKYEQPNRVVTEVTISNIPDHHEGRIDAILEFPNGHAILDWKTYDIKRANGSGHERWQLISNILLSNYRYTGNEDNWDRFLFASIVYYGGAYIPRLPIPDNQITKVKNDRKFAYDVLSGKYVRAEKPIFCPVCDTEAEGCSDCRFYRQDSKMAFTGQLPDNYRKITGQLFGNRYKVLEERAETHRHKHVLNTLTNSLGEAEALRELEKYGIVHSGYSFVSSNDTTVLLRRHDDTTFLEPRNVLRVIGKENNIAAISSLSEQATVIEVNGADLLLNFRSKVIVKRAELQLFHLPLILMKDEINLTRRMLEPLHKFHRIAADYLIAKECYLDAR
jgi:hypothetical protein